MEKEATAAQVDRSNLPWPCSLGGHLAFTDEGEEAAITRLASSLRMRSTLSQSAKVGFLREGRFSMHYCSEVVENEMFRKTRKQRLQHIHAGHQACHLAACHSSFELSTLLCA